VVRKFALYFGGLYLAVGVVGFLPFLGGSPNLEGKKLLGIFTVNLIHNLVHLVIGVAGITMSRSLGNATLFAKGVGVFLLAIGLIGIFNFPIFANTKDAFLPIGGIDVLLHLATGALALYVGFMAAEEGIPGRA
jgi:hypothetical protein